MRQNGKIIRNFRLRDTAFEPTNVSILAKASQMPFYLPLAEAKRQ
jgi:hypothetical protein